MRALLLTLALAASTWAQATPERAELEALVAEATSRRAEDPIKTVLETDERLAAWAVRGRLELGQSLEEARLALGRLRVVSVDHVQAVVLGQPHLFTQWVLEDGRRLYFEGVAPAPPDSPTAREADVVPPRAALVVIRRP